MPETCVATTDYACFGWPDGLKCALPAASAKFMILGLKSSFCKCKHEPSGQTGLCDKQQAMMIKQPCLILYQVVGSALLLISHMGQLM